MKSTLERYEAALAQVGGCVYVYTYILHINYGQAPRLVAMAGVVMAGAGMAGVVITGGL